MKSTGAVAVYSKPRAVAIAAAAVLITGGAGYALGLVTDDAPASEPAPRVVTQPAPEPQPAAAPAEATRADKRRAYRRGVAAGKRRAARRPGIPLAAGTYFIRLLPGGEDGTKLGRHFTLDEGRIYALCRGGASICFRQGTIAPPSG